MKAIKNLLASLLYVIGVILCYLAVLSFYNALIILPLSDIPIEIEGNDAFEHQKAQLYGDVFSVLIFSILAIILAPKCFSKARKLRRNKRLVAGVKYNEPFILYLRSFNADNLGEKLVDPLFATSNSEEEALINVLSEVAPVFAIGNPLDKYTPWGANRVYVEEHEWKSKVIEMMKYAKIVVLRLGETNNFWWEVEICLKSIDKDKIVFIVPYSHNFSTVAILYKYLFENNIVFEDNEVEISKASKGSISSFLYFGLDGSFFCNNMKSYKLTSWLISYENMIRNSLSSFFERYGLYYQKQMEISKARFIQITVILITGLFTLLYGYFVVYEIQHKVPLTNDRAIVFYVNKERQSCPRMIDSDTKLDSVLINRDNELQYNITIVNWAKDSLNIHFFENSISNSIINKVKTDPQLKYFRDNNVTLLYNYKDRDGEIITRILITPEKYR